MLLNNITDDINFYNSNVLDSFRYTSIDIIMYVAVSVLCACFKVYCRESNRITNKNLLSGKIQNTKI